MQPPKLQPVALSIISLLFTFLFSTASPVIPRITSIELPRQYNKLLINVTFNLKQTIKYIEIKANQTISSLI